VSDVVFFGARVSKCASVRHSGDNVTGAGAGDDEQIHIDLRTIPAHVRSLVLTVTSFRGHALADVGSMFVRVVDSASGAECIRYDVADLSQSAKAQETGLIICRFTRAGGSSWQMEALCVPVAHATTYRGCVASFPLD